MQVMASFKYSLIKVLLALFCSSARFKFITSQQGYYFPPYCPDSGQSSTSSGYVCNGLYRSCQTYIIFPAQSPYTSTTSIASLLGSNEYQIAQMNNVSSRAEFVKDEKVIVPIDCSCSGKFYQSNTSYVSGNEDPYLIASQVFKGLTTCKAIEDNNSFDSEKLVIPLRCACPTDKQSNQGINYLITYVIQQGDSVSQISLTFGADIGETLQANDMAEKDSIIQDLTTLLIPLRNQLPSYPVPRFIMHFDPAFLCIP